MQGQLEDQVTEKVHVYFCGVHVGDLDAGPANTLEHCIMQISAHTLKITESQDCICSAGKAGRSGDREGGCIFLWGVPVGDLDAGPADPP